MCGFTRRKPLDFGVDRCLALHWTAAVRRRIGSGDGLAALWQTKRLGPRAFPRANSIHLLTVRS